MTDNMPKIAVSFLLSLVFLLLFSEDFLGIKEKKKQKVNKNNKMPE